MTTGFPMPNPRTDPASIFGPDGRLSRILPAYEHRPEQEAMAAQVWRALNGPFNLAVEAGTGVGKSLAYLVPVAHRAKETGQRIAVSTYTRLLQTQLVKQDIPLLREVVKDLPDVRVAYGQENYLCRFRLRTRLAQGLFDTRKEADSADDLLNWAETSPDGILLDYPRTLSPRLRRQICRDSAACRRRDCPFFTNCHYFRARRDWEKSGILILNHFLFFAGLGEETDLLPRIDAVVFDEAHRLEDAAVRHFGTEVSHVRLRQLLDSLSPDRGRGIIRALGWTPGLQQSIEAEVAGCRNELQQFFQETDALLPSGLNRFRLKQPLADVPAVRLDRLGRTLKETAEQADDEGLSLELKGTARWLVQAAEAMSGFATVDTDNEVHWIEKDNRNEITLVSAPLSVAPIMEQNVYPAYSSVVLTSATLTVAGSFEFLSARLGLDDFQTLKLDSPFDYRRNGLLFVADKLPPPGDADFAGKAAALVSDLLRETRGRALVLFTSYQAMEDTRQLVQEDGYTCLCQGELPVAPLLKRFREDTHSVLFATQSFWQGVDVPGDSLSCLIIARLPFEVPDDPRLTAIAEQLRARGIRPFSAHQLPTAVLRFRQGFGRLIRTGSDRGIVCVLDSRILTRSYGPVFLSSLPEGLPLTTELKAVARFLRRTE